MRDDGAVLDPELGRKARPGWRHVCTLFPRGEDKPEQEVRSTEESVQAGTGARLFKTKEPGLLLQEGGSSPSDSAWAPSSPAPTSQIPEGRFVLRQQGRSIHGSAEAVAAGGILAEGITSVHPLASTSPPPPTV